MALSDDLRRETADLHHRVERSGVMRRLLRGELDRTGYCTMLRNLHVIYEALEMALRQHERHPAIGPIFDITLFRTERVVHDLVSLHGPDWPAQLAQAAAAQRYAQRLDELGASRPALLAAHAYVRYLGDLSGGQMLRRIVEKSLGLGARGTPTGLSFYDFGDAAAVKSSAIRFRTGLDQVGVLAADAGVIVDEARFAFRLHEQLFIEL